MPRPKRKPYVDYSEPRNALYAACVALGVECSHGVAAGQVIRPWCQTPACPACRRVTLTWVKVENYARNHSVPVPDVPALEAAPFPGAGAGATIAGGTHA